MWGFGRRFLDALERLHPKSRELAMFGEVLDACEADEVAYFVQARRALLPPAESSEVAPLLSLEAARRGCEALIMRQASDVHARRVRTSVTERLLAKPGVLVRGGAPVEEPARVDGAALLGELMRVQREEKRELCRMLQQLHATGAGLPGFPEVHRLRAVLQAVEPDVSDAELLEIFQRASVAAPHPVPEAPGRAPLRTVPFANLWAALQRHGFLARRQRLGALSAPGEGSGGGAAAGPRERDAAAAVAEIWMALHSQARALVGRLARSPLQAHRDAAARAAALVDVVQESASVAAAAPHLVSAPHPRRSAAATLGEFPPAWVRVQLRAQVDAPDSHAHARGGCRGLSGRFRGCGGCCPRSTRCRHCEMSTVWTAAAPAGPTRPLRSTRSCSPSRG